ncbi:MAG TPA: type II secretion system minor pseudopilin GspI [Steroidobacteraceae bacterium]|nr:type II secretion system minor pseudopilin GspI [Steroidobacteraceae bacterium]
MAPLRLRGFTLLEVLVALVIVALGMSALLETLTESARNIAALRDRTVAEWIAMNQLALVRLNLNAPTIGTTQGDVQNCANGNWHWRQQVSAVDAVPGLLSITVSVRRTGNASNTSGPATAGAAAGNGTNGTSGNGTAGNPGIVHPGAIGQLGPNISLGPTAPLGSVTSLSTAGCASAVAPGSSLGGGSDSLGAPAPGSLGAPSTLGGSSQLSGPSLSATSAATGSGPGAGPFGLVGSNATGSGGAPSGGSASGSDAGSNGSSSTSSSAGAPQWLVTLTGFRGNSLGAASGESPDWAGSNFAGNAGTNGTPNGSQGLGSSSSGGVSSTPLLLNAPLP